jgi:hypothetical protein
MGLRENRAVPPLICLAAPRFGAGMGVTPLYPGKGTIE